jgi:hypothetical protein
MKLLYFSLLGILITFLTSCQTCQTASLQTCVKDEICGEKSLICPQNRKYSVTYDECCSFPVTYKTKKRKKIIVLQQSKRIQSCYQEE